MTHLTIFSDGSDLALSIEAVAKKLNYDVTVVLINNEDINFPDAKKAKSGVYFIAISPSNLNILKANLIKIAKIRGYRLANIFDESARYSDSCIFGDNIFLAKNVILRENAVIGDGVYIASGSIVEPNSVISQNADIGSKVHVMANSSIGRNTIIGDNLKIDSISIGDYCYISNHEIKSYAHSIENNTYYLSGHSNPVVYFEKN